MLSMIMDAKKCGAQEVYIPQANAAEGKLIHGIDVYTVATLKELVEHLKGKNTLTPLPKKIFCRTITGFIMWILLTSKASL